MRSTLKTAIFGLVFASVMVQGTLWIAANHLDSETGETFDPEQVSDSVVGTAEAQALTVPNFSSTLPAVTVASANIIDPTIPVPPLPDLAMSEYVVRSGDTLISIWQKIGGPTGGCEQLVKALKEAGLTARSLRAGEVLKYIKNHLGEITEVHKSLVPPNALIIKGDSKIGYTSLIHEPKIITKERPVTGIIERSVSEAALALDVPYEVIDAYVDLFSGRIEFRRDLQPGDRFTVIYEEKRLERGELIGPGEIISASLIASGDVMHAVRYLGSDGQVRYFDEDGESLAKTFLRYPLNFSRISSAFSTSRFHPVLKKRRPHNGVDFAAPTGTAVRSVADGVVNLAGWSGGGGKTIKIQHGSRYATAYLHLSQILPNIKRGSRVKRGQVIGKVGKTGLATGPHLHFSFYDRGKYVDPLSIKLPRMDEGPAAKIPQEALEQAIAKLMELTT